MANLSALRLLNRRRVLQAMFRLRTASRMELAHQCGMSQATVSRIVDMLLAERLLVEGPNAGSNGTAVRVGRPTASLSLDDQQPRFLAVHVGVGRTRLALLPLALNIQSEHWSVAFPTPRSAADWLKAFRKATQQLTLPDRLEAVALSVPGVVDEAQPKVLLSPNLHWTERFDFRQVTASLGTAALVCVQEIRALAIGQMNVEQDPKSFLLVDFGAGVGGAVVVDQQIYSGPLPLSGELGHTPLVDNKRRCGCGGVGCLETIIGRNAVLEASRLKHASIEALSQAIATQGIPRWFQGRLDATATVIAGALNVLGIRELVLTGYMHQLPAVVTEYLARAIANDAMWGRFGEIACVVRPRHRLAGLASVAIQKTILASD